jgi:hypothetical protein
MYYFFGEKHESIEKRGCSNLLCDTYTSNGPIYYNQQCIGISLLIHHWLNYNNKNNIVTDFYIEEKFIDNNVRTQKKQQRESLKQGNYNTSDISWMQVTAFNMEPCLVKNKIGCPYLPNVHSHYIDVRYIDQYGFTLDPFNLDFVTWKINDNFPKDMVIIRKLNQDIKLIINFFIKHYKDLLNIMLIPNKLDTINNYINMYDKQFSTRIIKTLFVRQLEDIKKMSKQHDAATHRVAAELTKLKHINPKMASKIFNFIHNKAQNYINLLSSNYNQQIGKFEALLQVYFETTYLQPDLENIKELFLFFLSNMTDALIPLSALSMDTYLLARMFTQQASTEVIVYTGVAHADLYNDFFTTQLKTMPLVSVTYTNNKCVHVDNLKDYIDINKFLAT